MHSNTTLVKVKWLTFLVSASKDTIQIQHLLKLNTRCYFRGEKILWNSNTTLVKVKLSLFNITIIYCQNSNTTLVKVKYNRRKN